MMLSDIVLGELGDLGRPFVTIELQYLRGLEQVAEQSKECLVRMEDARDAATREVKKMRKLLDQALLIIKADHPKDYAEALRILGSRQ
jgi:hypothetical protein